MYWPEQITLTAFLQQVGIVNDHCSGCYKNPLSKPTTQNEQRAPAAAAAPALVVEQPAGTPKSSFARKAAAAKKVEFESVGTAGTPNGGRKRKAVASAAAVALPAAPSKRRITRDI